MLRIARRSVLLRHPLPVARAPLRHLASTRDNRALAAVAAEKAEGTIASVFASLSGEQASVLPDRFAELKRTILADESVRAAVVASWDDLLSELRRYNAEIKSRRQGMIPQVPFEDFINSPNGSHPIEEVKTRGCVVVKGLVSPEMALGWKQSIVDFCLQEPGVKGYPEDAPQVFELYWTLAQLGARGHPNFLAATRRLNQLFRGSPSTVALNIPLSYADRLRIRQPGDTTFALGPHADSGSVERWEDPTYRSTFSSILSGRWRDYDPFDIGGRPNALMDLYDAAGGCSVLRTFQGWLSMSETGPNEGTLKFYPGIKLSSAYSILRPFFRQTDRGNGWELDLDSSTFPGSALGRAQEFFDGPSGSTHPDLELPETMVSMPRVQPGDAVFWHCDGIHAVEASHEGASDSSVLYIPSAPLTLANARYLARQRGSFLSGRPPPDLPGGVGESRFEGRGRDKDVVDLDARRAMGLEPFEEVGEAAPLIKEANRILGFA